MITRKMRLSMAMLTIAASVLTTGNIKADEKDTTNETNTEFKIGKAKRLTDGKDAAIIVCGQLVATALQAAEELKEEGINVSVVDISWSRRFQKFFCDLSHLYGIRRDHYCQSRNRTHQGNILK